jgi:cell division protease FtsH
MAELPDPGAFGAAFEDFMHAMSFVAEHKESEVSVRLREHLGGDPKELPTTGAEFPMAEQANLQLAIDAVLGDAAIVGFATRHMGFGSVGLAEIVAGQAMMGAISVGPVQYADVEVGDGRVIQCIVSALFLAVHRGSAIALVLSRGGDHPMAPSSLKLEGVSASPGMISELLRELRSAMREHNVFRGRIISLHQRGQHETVSVQYHALPSVTRESVILPAGTMERLERHTVAITERADRLRSAGQHLKRGVLLHGPPGTGKTLSVMYLLHAMAGRTTILLTGRGLGLIEQALAIGRELAPATFVFEDVDLIAAERTMPFASEGLLFELLNQMEGLAEDEDLLFLLTTNRPDVIEPALAARPGRIDLALEIPLPDEDGRRRLLALYGKGIAVDAPTEAALVERSAGVSGAFIKELTRQAWLRGALQDRDTPTGDDLVEVLDELLEERSTLTRRLLGQPRDGAAGAPGEGPFPAMLHALGAAGLPIPPSASSAG